MIPAPSPHPTGKDEHSPSVGQASLRGDRRSRRRAVVCSHSRRLREGIALALAQDGLIDVSRCRSCRPKARCRPTGAVQ